MWLKPQKRQREADFFRICKECPEGCCTQVRPPLTLYRQRKIREYVNANGIASGELFEKGRYVYPRETKGGRCIFSDRSTKRCRIHPVKPETCVAAPITFDVNAKTRKIEWFLKTEKNCLLSAPLYKNRIEYIKHVRCAKREILHLLHGLDANALCAVLSVEEPDTIEVGENKVPPEILAKVKPLV